MLSRAFGGFRKLSKLVVSFGSEISFRDLPLVMVLVRLSFWRSKASESRTSKWTIKRTGKQEMKQASKQAGKKTGKQASMQASKQSKAKHSDPSKAMQARLENGQSCTHSERAA